MYLLRDYLLKEYGRKLYKISIDAGFTCPNRDGSKGTGGCIFCSSGGSGDFAEKTDAAHLHEAIERGKHQIAQKFHPDFPGPNYIAYFQAFTNTYAPVETLKTLFETAIAHKDIAILSIATRPDCLGDDVIRLLCECNQKKPVWIELGLQTINDSVADFLNRGYPTKVYDDAVGRLRRAGIKVVTHVILGLPYETKQDMKATIAHVAAVGSWGIKIQLLHILKGTKLEKIYAKSPFFVFSLEQYTEFLKEILEMLPEDMIVHRLTGDGPKNLLIAPKWSMDKKRVLNEINQVIHHCK